MQIGCCYATIAEKAVGTPPPPNQSDYRGGKRNLLFLSHYLFIYLFVYLFIYLFHCLFVYVFIQINLLFISINYIIGKIWWALFLVHRLLGPRPPPPSPSSNPSLPARAARSECPAVGAVPQGHRPARGRWVPKRPGRVRGPWKCYRDRTGRARLSRRAAAVPHARDVSLCGGVPSLSWGGLGAVCVCVCVCCGAARRGAGSPAFPPKTAPPPPPLDAPVDSPRHLPQKSAAPKAPKKRSSGYNGAQGCP